MHLGGQIWFNDSLVYLDSKFSKWLASNTGWPGCLLRHRERINRINWKISKEKENYWHLFGPQEHLWSGGGGVDVRKRDLHVGPEEQEYRTSKAWYSEEILALNPKLYPLFSVLPLLILPMKMKFTFNLNWIPGRKDTWTDDGSDKFINYHVAASAIVTIWILKALIPSCYRDQTFRP